MDKNNKPLLSIPMLIILVLAVILIAPLLISPMLYPAIIKFLEGTIDQLVRGATQSPIGLAITCALGYFLVHFLILRLKGQTTRSGRILGFLLTFVVPFSLLFMLLTGFRSSISGDGLEGLGILLMILIGILIWFPGFIVYSMPCTFLSSLPLLLHYLLIALAVSLRNAAGIAIFVFAYLPLAGYMFPRHRRLADFWRPAPLPRLKAPDARKA